MKKNKLVQIIEKLLNEGISTSAQDVGIANSNQYYCELEAKGITTHRWVYKDGIRYKERFIKNKAKAYEFLTKHTKKVPKIKA